MKKLIRALLLSDLRAPLSYPFRVLLFYSVVALSLPVLLYLKLKEKMGAAQAFEVVKELLFYEVLIGITLVLGAFVYAFVVGSDYSKVKEFARRTARGDFNCQLRLSSLADREVVELYNELLKLRNSLVVSRELLKKRFGK